MIDCRIGGMKFNPGVAERDPSFSEVEKGGRWTGRGEGKADEQQSTKGKKRGEEIEARKSNNNKCTEDM